MQGEIDRIGDNEWGESLFLTDYYFGRYLAGLPPLMFGVRCNGRYNGRERGVDSKYEFFSQPFGSAEMFHFF